MIYSTVPWGLPEGRQLLGAEYLLILDIARAIHSLMPGAPRNRRGEWLISEREIALVLDAPVEVVQHVVSVARRLDLFDLTPAEQRAA